MLSLVATGRVDIIAPYPPYFCGGHSGDELVSKSQESLLSSEVGLYSMVCSLLGAPCRKESKLWKLSFAINFFKVSTENLCHHFM